MASRMNHSKNNARIRGLRDHVKTDAQKKREKKWGTPPKSVRKEVVKPAQKQKQKTKISTEADIKRWLKDHGFE